MKKLTFITGLFVMLFTTSSWAGCLNGSFNGWWHANTMSAEGYGAARCTIHVQNGRVVARNTSCYNVNGNYWIDASNPKIYRDNDACLMYIDFYAGGMYWETMFSLARDKKSAIGYYTTNGDHGPINAVKK